MKKTVSVILALITVFSLCACGSSAGKGMTVRSGKLVMATNATFAPYEFISDVDSTTIVGIDAEIAGLIAGNLGLELIIEDMEFGSILTAVQTGKVDIGMSSMTVTEERLRNVSFSEIYARGVQSVIVPEGSPITSVDDLYGDTVYKIAVLESGTGQIFCEDDFGAENVIAYSNGAFAVEAMLSGNADCVIIDNEPAKVYVAGNPGLRILDTNYAEEDYAIAVSKENEALLNAINGQLSKLLADGSVQAIIDKYIAA